MKYYFDTEYCAIARVLITLSIIREDNVAMYIGLEGSLDKIEDTWVKDNVVPYIDKAQIPCRWVDRSQAQEMLTKFFANDKKVELVTDWPDDITYLSELMITGPGKMIDIPGFTVELVRIDAYPTEVTPAVRHNAYWDAMALKQKIQFPNGMDFAELIKIQEDMFKFNPVTGEELIPNEFTGIVMRRRFPDVPWYFNPWTGVRRADEAALSDPFGEKIKYGD